MNESMNFGGAIEELKEKNDKEMWELIKKYAHYNLPEPVFEADHITREQLESWLEKQLSELKKLEVFAKHGDGMYYLYNNNITYLCGNQTSDIEQDVKETFHVTPPESKESDDKRIIKILQNIVRGACSKYGIKWRGVETSEEDLLAWLETHKYTEEDLDKAYKCADKVQYMSGYNDAKEEIELHHITPECLSRR